MTADRPAQPGVCWLCGRPLGRRVERHHPHPKSRGGRVVVPVHPICHRALHAAFSNRDLATMGEAVIASPELSLFLRWIANKPPDFHAPTRQTAKDRFRRK